MSSRHELHAYIYINHPYEAVRDLLLASPLTVLRDATTAVALRNGALGGELHPKTRPLDISAEVEIKVLAVAKAARSSNGHPATQLEIEWKAGRRPVLFPTMRATLSVHALTPGETQLDLAGIYEPPPGALGEALDAVTLHRMARESVSGFVQDVAMFLRILMATGNAA